VLIINYKTFTVRIQSKSTKLVIGRIQSYRSPIQCSSLVEILPFAGVLFMHFFRKFQVQVQG